MWTSHHFSVFSFFSGNMWYKWTLASWLVDDSRLTGYVTTFKILKWDRRHWQYLYKEFLKWNNVVLHRVLARWLILVKRKDDKPTFTKLFKDTTLSNFRQSDFHQNTITKFGDPSWVSVTFMMSVPRVSRIVKFNLIFELSCSRAYHHTLIFTDQNTSRSMYKSLLK